MKRFIIALLTLGAVEGSPSCSVSAVTHPVKISKTTQI